MTMDEKRKYLGDPNTMKKLWYGINDSSQKISK